MNKAENKQKLFSSGGIFVDLFIGFLIAACIAGVVYRCFIYDPNARLEEGEPYWVYFEIVDAYESYASYLQENDAVYDAQTGMRIGSLILHDASAQDSAVSVQQPLPQSEQPVRVQGHRSGRMPVQGPVR